MPDTVDEFASLLSPLAAFLYLALFRAVRDFLGSFQPSNPTWIKAPASYLNRARPTFEAIAKRFLLHVTDMASSQRDLFSQAQPDNTDPVAVKVAVANSSSLPCDTASATAAITSPPYCTRIDYAVATAPELAVLGLSRESFLTLRQSSIGGVITTDGDIQYSDAWGPCCGHFLERVASHRAKASGTYYLRNHLQYFDQIFRSLTELDRVLVPGAPCVLVVQDSYYKDIHNDLPRIFTEMAQSMGWQLTERQDYEAHALMARVHPARSRYRTSTEATESVLWFRNSG